jgi:hypothetical protein
VVGRGFSRALGLVIGLFSAHLHKMINKTSLRLLDVDVMALEPTCWKWTISEKSLEVLHGYATSRETAQADGDSALFKLLSFSHPAP